MSPTPRILLTSRLILVPTPTAVSLPTYVDFFRGVLSDGRVTGMGWADKEPKAISYDECVEILKTKNHDTWDLHGFGDFATAELPETLKDRAPGALGEWVELGADVLGVQELDSLRWVGYSCIRDATGRILEARARYLTKHSQPPPNAVDGELPPWQEMIEIKYGFHPSHWGKGYATEVVHALHKWGVELFGLRRFIGATLKSNTGSRRVLQKIGYVAYDKKLWWEYDDDDEWVFHAPS
ncbi:hypothetical protein AURDEDRAFT_185105 [Auricularia subglabra TFB-10046 SS5]|nr:hypothetical protein AURDEDRAFT_185105 [Auricularia subglabra TFB-10046 SS5]